MAVDRCRISLSVLLMIAHQALPLVACADTYQVHIRTEVEKANADAKMTLRYHNLGKQPLVNLRLRLDVNLSPRGRMTITSVLDKNGTELPWRYVPFNFGKMSSERAQIQIDLQEPLDANRHLELQVTYSLADSRHLNKEMITFQDDRRSQI